MVRLRRSRPGSSGWTRRRAGRGFVYLDAAGQRLTAPADLARIAELVIPPAWHDVWICPWPHGHVQATGLDDAGRRQYLYHPQWRAQRDRRKHDEALLVGQRLPAARRRVRRDLAAEGMPRGKALALAFRLLDQAYLRVGGESYARANGSYGLATLRREHVRVLRDDGSAVAVALCFPAKSGRLRETVVEDPRAAAVVATLMRRHEEGREFLAWHDDAGWHDVTSADIGADVRARLGECATPKVFRTWHATVLAAEGFARVGEAPSAERARRRAVRAVVDEVADALGNTPAVARASYIDPRVIEEWEHGRTITPTRSHAVAERRTLDLLD